MTIETSDKGGVLLSDKVYYATDPDNGQYRFRGAIYGDLSGLIDAVVAVRAIAEMAGRKAWLDIDQEFAETKL